MDPKIILRFAFRETMGTVIAGAALFWSAGRMDWWAGWALVALLGIWAATTAVVILRTNPDLLAERLAPRKGVKKWDLAVMGLVGVLTLVRLVVAGLDLRFGWTGSFPPAVQVLALILCTLGYALVLWSTAANAYFSQTVRIQEERGHKVARGGPYRFVRHPAYAGTILFELFSPILLASWWALIPGGLNALLFILRTSLEDRTLQKELIGYADFTRQVRFRLLPGIW
jgi:protein-S-isoprenylcysteine O-methyltransferase Ste14